MPQRTDGVEWGDIRAAVKVILDAVVPSVGRVVDTPGEEPRWNGERIFWDISVTSATETAIAAPRTIEDRPVVQVEGWLPLSVDNPRSVDLWDARVKAVRRALRDERTLNGTVDDCELPQTTANDIQPFRHLEGQTLCHHCAITVETICDVEYAAP